MEDSLLTATENLVNHNGPADAITADADLIKESILDVIADALVSIKP
jgi:hypothetical protein